MRPKAARIGGREGAGPGQCRRDVDLWPQQDGRLLGQQITQHPAAGGGQRSRDHGNCRRSGGGKPECCTHHAVGGKAYRIEPDQQPVSPFDQMRGEEHHHAGRDAGDDVIRLDDPEHRHLAEQQVPQRPATDAGDGGEKQETDQVQLLARRGKGAGCRKHDDACVVEDSQHFHLRTAQATSVAQVRGASLQIRICLLTRAVD